MMEAAVTCHSGLFIYLFTFGGGLVSHSNWEEMAEEGGGVLEGRGCYFNTTLDSWQEQVKKMLSLWLMVGWRGVTTR